eukprot:8994192-Alexandrium_andersonii.AAC.1
MAILLKPKTWAVRPECCAHKGQQLADGAALRGGVWMCSACPCLFCADTRAAAWWRARHA